MVLIFRVLVGTVHWKFICKDSIMTVVSSVSYVPFAKACFISPPQVFNAAKGVTGEFVVEESKSTLSFDGIGELVVDYDTRSHLPTALAKNHTPGQA